MPVFVAAFLGGLAQIAASLVGRVLLALGMSYVTYKGIDASITFLVSHVMQTLQGLPADILQIAALTKIDKAIAILSAAFMVRLTLNGLTGGAIKKLVVK